MRASGTLLSATIFGIASAALGSHVAAQVRPDYSGPWTVEDSVTSSGERRTGDVGSGWGSTISITQDDRQLTVEYAFFERRDMQPPLSFVFALGGRSCAGTLFVCRASEVQGVMAMMPEQTTT